MKCSICQTEFSPMIVYGDYPDPGEPCRCGWNWEHEPLRISDVGWEGIINHWRYRLADWLIEKVACLIMPESK